MRQNTRLDCDDQAVIQMACELFRQEKMYGITSIVDERRKRGGPLWNGPAPEEWSIRLVKDTRNT